MREINVSNIFCFSEKFKGDDYFQLPGKRTCTCTNCAILFYGDGHAMVELALYIDIS